MTIATTGVSRAADARALAAAGPGRPARSSPPTGTSSASRPTWCAGRADYERFVRKHLHLFAPAEDGEVEAGPVARAPGARAVRAAAGRRASARSTPRSWQRAVRPRRGARALADRDAVPRRRAAHPAGAPVRGADAGARRRRPSPPRGRPALPAGADRRRASAARRRSAVLGAATGAPVAARRPRARARRARLGGVPPARARSSGCRWCSRSTPPRAPSPTPTASSASCRAEAAALADDRAARGGLPALRADRGDARRRARRFAAALDELVSVVRRAALPRLPPAGRPGRGALGLLGRVLTRRAAVRRAPAPRARRTSAATRSARRPSRAPGAATSARAGSSSPSAARRAARRAPRRRPPTAATRRWSATSGSRLRSASWAASSRSWAAR